MGHDFSRQITEKCGINMKMGTIFWDTQNGNGNYILGRMEYYYIGPLFGVGRDQK